MTQKRHRPDSARSIILFIRAATIPARAATLLARANLTLTLARIIFATVRAMFARVSPAPALAALGLAVVLAGCAAPVRTAATGDRLYSRGAVAADHPLASAAGVEILRQGGNAVDAAVATSFALSVVRPFSCGIGGGGFMIIAEPQDGDLAPQLTALNYRETAPAAVGRDFYVERDDPVASRFGAAAVAVPGTVAGLLFALDQHGALDRRTVLAPAIRLAENGFPADAAYLAAVADVRSAIEEHPHLAAAADGVWTRLCNRGDLALGDRVYQRDQAKALRLIAAQGASAFYEGAIADAIVETMHAHDGVITHADLANYTVEMTTPLINEFRGDLIVSMPPPSSGGVAMQQILEIYERLLDRQPADVALPAHNDAAYVHFMTESMKHAFANRARHLADPNFVDVPIDAMLDYPALDALAARVRDDRTLSDPQAYGQLAPLPEDGGTSHISVVDQNGMAVACTETINLRFGSLVEVGGFGFVLNDEMDDFTTIPGAANAFGLRQSDDNLPEAGKRPLSSMSPTIIMRDGRVFLVAGASGGPRIITGTLQTLVNVMLFDMGAADAVAAPRFHHQWLPDRLDFEETWTDQAVIDAMSARGHATGEREGVGVVQLIRVDADGIQAAADPRKGGEARGY